MLRKIRAIERVFKQLDRETEKFRNASGLSCLSNCSLCCQKRDLQANVLEFLPLAYYLVSNNMHEQALEQIEKNPTHCINLGILNEKNRSFGCTIYPHRGMVCRLFGLSAMKDKNQKLSIYTCKSVKSAFPEAYSSALEKINSGMKIPVVSDFYYRIYFLDPYLANDYNPINQSIRKAIDIVAYYFLNKPRRIRTTKKTA